MAQDYCSQAGANTGWINCSTKRARPVQPYVGGTVFTSTDTATKSAFKSKLISATKLAAGDPGKLFPFPEIGKITNNTAAPTTGQLPFGPVKRLTKGNPTYTYTVDITWDRYQKLLAFDGKTLPVFTRCDDNEMWGFRPSADENKVNDRPFTGEMAYITIQGMGFTTGENIEDGLCTITIAYQSVDDFEKRGASVTVDNISTSDTPGLKDAIMVEKSAHASNVYKIGLIVPTSKVGQDLDWLEENSVNSALAALTFTAGSGTGFATTLDITSIAADTAAKALTVTFDSEDFTALANGERFILRPPSVSVLDTGGVTGIEIAPIILTK